VKFSVIEKDALGNIHQGLNPKNVKWAAGDLAKKVPDVCYIAPDQLVTVVFFITVEPATYHGTRTVKTTANTQGTISGNDGGSADYEGTTTSSTVVPEEFEYGRYTLTVETMTPDKKAVVRHRFQQDGIYNVIYGMSFGKGKHPEQTLIQEAAEWIHSGGLVDPFQTADQNSLPRQN
jgi:hypothetical protein